MKPIVFYSGEPTFHISEHGEYASVYALNHPRLGQQRVTTSIVLSKQDNGFETLNTLYRKNTWPFPTLTKLTYGRRKGELYGFGAGVGVGKPRKTQSIKEPLGFEDALI